MRPIAPLLLALLAFSCQSGSYRLAFEGRFAQSNAEEESFTGADKPQGASVAILSLPIQGAKRQVGVEFGVGEGEDSLRIAGGEYELRHREIWLGVNYAFLDGHWRPYVGGGVQYSQQEVNLTFGGSTMERTTEDFGPYVEAGMRVRFNVSTHFVIGYRRTIGLDGNIGATDVDLDYSQGFIGFGYSF
ncbi:MAG: outer membrane beta-barrel protein [Planctomycetes bacterium]|nr:outer membrane beta-barrel protein [Planctomycetota bacterium]